MSMYFKMLHFRFILELGKEMKLSHNTMATGAVYYHRFYMFHSFQDFNRYVVSTCCLFLAGKAEETPKKCKDIRKIWIYIDEKFSHRKIFCKKNDNTFCIFSSNCSTIDQWSPICFFWSWSKRRNYGSGKRYISINLLIFFSEENHFHETFREIEFTK